MPMLDKLFSGIPTFTHVFFKPQITRILLSAAVYGCTGCVTFTLLPPASLGLYHKVLPYVEFRADIHKRDSISDRTVKTGLF
jgi:hypothetical protein